LIHEQLIRAGRRLARRRHIPLALGVGGYLEHLRQSGIRHAVLFNSDVDVCRRHALIVLVHDDDAERAREGLGAVPSGLRCELYSVTGLPGFGYGDVPLLPPRRAAEMLACAVQERTLAGLRPCAWHHVLCGAYHRLYLMADAANAADDALLDHAGWTPPLEMLERMAETSPHARVKASALGGNEVEGPGFVLFFIRERAVEAGLVRGLRRALELKGFEVLKAFPLTEATARIAAEHVRGGNWGRGPFAKSGGGPALLLAAFDLVPQPARKLSGAFIDNARIVEAKASARALVKQALAPHEQFNALHSTDTASQAWRLLKLIDPEAVSELRAIIAARRLQFTTSETVINSLTRFGNRAKVEVVRFEGRLCVKKTYRPGAERFLAREIGCLTAFRDLPEVPPLIARGDNWMMIPLYRNIWEDRRWFGFRLPKLLPLDVTRQLAEFVKIAARQGYDLIDMTPHNNIILDPELGLKILDFEFALHRPELTDARQSWCLTGVPADFAGDVPTGSNYVAAPWEEAWFAHVGLSMESFLDDPAWLQRVKRMENFARLCARLVLRKLKRERREESVRRETI
jgi:hypothetical protein